MSSIPDGTNTNAELDTNDAINLLLNRDNTPNQASENIQESEDTQEVSAEETEVENEVAVDDQATDEEVDEESEQYDEETDEEEVAVYLAKVDGEEVEVSADDLIKSYQLEATAQKRLREAAEERKKIQTDAQQVEAERKYYAENLALLQNALSQTEQGNRSEAEWAELYQRDPIAYMKAKEDVRDKQSKVQALQQEQLALQQRQVETEQVKLLERIPAWKDPEVANMPRR